MSRSDAKTRSDAKISSQKLYRNLFFTILSLLRARAADALETAKQQKVVYSICRFGKEDKCCSIRSGFTKEFCQSDSTADTRRKSSSGNPLLLFTVAENVRLIRN